MLGWIDGNGQRVDEGNSSPHRDGQVDKRHRHFQRTRTHALYGVQDNDPVGQKNSPEGAADDDGKPHKHPAQGGWNQLSDQFDGGEHAFPDSNASPKEDCRDQSIADDLLRPDQRFAEHIAPDDLSKPKAKENTQPYGQGEKKSRAGGLSFAWYMGYAVVLYLFWVAEAAIGALFGNLIPDPHAIGLDFMLPIYFLGMVMEFRKRPLWLPIVGASAAASIAAYYIVGSPWHVSIGAVAGVTLAALLTPSRREGLR